MSHVRTWTPVVDRGIRSRYKAALFALGTLLLAPLPAYAGNLVVRGAVLPPGSQQVGEDRYKSPSNYADTLTFYSKQYKGNPRKPIVNQPNIRGIHLVNDGRGDWEGLNIYELDGETKIYVVARDPVVKPDAGKDKGGGKKP
jgi:hypothetical protein